MKEVCSCGASFEIPDVKLWTAAALLEHFKAWRENHRHEFAPAAPEHAEPPFIDETSSSHERAEPRFPLGFAVEPEEGWH